jgi:hypothetical protein
MSVVNSNVSKTPRTTIKFVSGIDAAFVSMIFRLELFRQLGTVISLLIVGF